MDSSHYAPRLGFWIATIIVIMITAFPIVFQGAFPDSGGGQVAEFWNMVVLALIPSICVSLIQVFIMTYPSLLARIKWFGITFVSTVLGWCIVFVFSNLLVQWRSLPVISDRLLPAIFYGFIYGASIGAIIGLVTGIIQGYIHRLSMRQWIIGNLISWSLGIAVPLAVLFGGISQIRISF